MDDNNEVDNMIVLKKENKLTMGILISNLRKYFPEKGVRDFIINALFDVKP
jgi:hypothetical protein